MLQISKSVKNISFVFAVLAVSWALSYSVLAAWTEPGAVPPNNNVSAPINVGSSGQIKSGNLQVNALWIDAAGNALLVPNGNVGLGTVVPKNRLDVEGASVIGATYSGTNIAPANGLLVEGNVGIGDASPSQKLEVAGRIKVASGAAPVLADAGAIEYTAANGFRGWNGTGWESFTASAGSLPAGLSGQTIRHNGTAWIATDSIYNLGNNVGIGGTKNPKAELQISSNGSDNTTYRPLYVQNNGSEAVDVNPAAFVNNNNVGVVVGGHNGDNFGLVNAKGFVNGKGEVIKNLILNSDGGNVGIGILNPAQNLEVNGKIKIGNDGTTPTAGTIRWNNGSTNFEGYNGTGWESFSLPDGILGQTMRHNGTRWIASAAIYNDGANVGLGTANPKNQLDVEGAAVIGAAYSGTNTAPANSLLVEGSVGIGDVTPSQKLEVNGKIKVGNDTVTASAGTIRWNSTTIDFEGYNGTGWESFTTSSGSLPAGTSNGQTIRYNGTAWIASNAVFNDGANVGLGTAVPKNQLDVEGASVIGATYSGTNIAPVNGLLVEGNTGIGTTAPLSQLQVGRAGDGATDYLQIDSRSTVPPVTDCDSDTERGRMIVVYTATGNRLAVCNGAARGWDYIVMTDLF